ncbi:MAG: Lrp/AsnC family transcriptional regulator [Candidatus Helarchaeota archaeon]
MNQNSNNKPENIIAFILMETESDKTENILEFLKERNDVKESYIIYGDWDILIKINVERLPDLTHFVMNIRKIKGVRKTSTLIAMQNI